MTEIQNLRRLRARPWCKCGCGRLSTVADWAAYKAARREAVLAVYEAAKEGDDLRAEMLVVLPEWAVQIEEAHRDGCASE